MPYVLMGLQGSQKLVSPGVLELSSIGSLSEEEFDASMQDLVNFLAYVAEPARITRERNGFYIILFFIVFTAVMWLLYREYAKEIK